MPNEPRIEVLETGHSDRNDSDFATIVMLDHQAVLCGFSVGRLRFAEFAGRDAHSQLKLCRTVRGRC